jgi:hypothetical protein
MAGTFYSIARNDINARMLDKVDRRVTVPSWYTSVKQPAPAANVATGTNARGGPFARAWRLLTRPASRKAEGSSSI